MAELFPSGYGMLAVMGLTRPELDRLITESADGQEQVWIANVNSFDQMVVTGANAALQQIADLAGGRGARTERLQVAVPSHAPILEPVTRELRSLLRLVPIRPLVASYVTTSSARRARDAGEVLEDLAVSVSQTVRWRDAFRLITKLGADLVVEVPPGHALVGLAKSIGNSAPPGHLGLIAMSETPFAECAHLIRQSNDPHQNKAF
jgi:malonate decarboxylase epsilon subunit